MANDRISRVLLAALLFIIPTIAFAAPVSRQQASAIAANFMQQHGMTAAKPNMVFRAPRRQAAKNSYYYVFNSADNGGFVIVSGDDRTPQILGYSDSGTFDDAEMPQNIRAFLQTYADEICHLDDANITEVQKTPVLKAPSGTTHPVSPFLTSTWNQDSPYNNNCPNWNDQTTVTGCVATAMAQVMYYYKWPAQTTAAIPSYSYTASNITTDVAGEAAGKTLDWNNMLSNYTGAESDAQKTAVANLMLYAGKSVSMQYMPSNYGGSSAATAAIPSALKNYFDYSSQIIERSDYSLAEFEQTIYDEVAASRPVLFGGQSTGGGHAFVIDGYDGSGLFHVNWGWGGMSNGYFRLSVLNPNNTTGIGASSSNDGYSMNQEAVVGIRKHAGQSNVEPAALTFQDISVSNNQLNFTCFNLTGEANNFDAALAILDADGNIQQANSFSSNTNIQNYSGFSYHLPLGNYISQQGTYRIALISRVSGTTDWVVKQPYILDVTRDASGKFTATSSSVSNLKASAWNFTGSKLSGLSQPVSITISNTGSEYYGSVYLFASTTTTKGQSYSSTGLTAKANGETTIELNFTPSSAGTYNVWLCGSADGSDEIGSTTVEIGEGSSSANLALVGFTVDNSNGSTVYGSDIKGITTVKNNSSVAFGGNVILYIMAPGNDGYYHSFQSVKPTLNIPAGGTTSFDFDFDGLTIGSNYLLALYYSDNQNRIGNYSTYSLANGIITYNADGTTNGQAAQTTFNVPATATAVDFTGVESTVTSVNTANANPNALYYFSTSSNAAKALADAKKNVIVNGQAEELTLTDGNDFSAPKAFTATSATFTRIPALTTDGVHGWQTLCLPFEATSVTVDGKPLHWFTSSDDKGKDFWLMDFAQIDGSKVVFGFNSGSTIAANKPYIIAIPGSKWGAQYDFAGKTLSFNGTNVSISATADVPIVTGSMVYNFLGTTIGKAVSGAYMLNADGTAFTRSTSATANPFTAYFVSRELSSVSPNTLSIYIQGNGETTGISQVKSTTDELSDGPAFNLSGQRVGTGYKGIVIRNGKKVIQK